MEEKAELTYGQKAELTYGQKAVGITFNHAEGEIGLAVEAVKQAFADAIDLIQAERAKDTTPSEKGAMFTLAIREAQSAQMWAVKAVTWESK
jgi:hypothetical protein